MKTDTKVCYWTVITNFPQNKTKVECHGFIEDSFSDGFIFCPYCGRKIKFINLPLLKNK